MTAIVPSPQYINEIRKTIRAQFSLISIYLVGELFFKVVLSLDVSATEILRFPTTFSANYQLRLGDLSLLCKLEI